MATKLRITPEDLTSGRAYVRFSTEAKIALCERAGAPWYDKNPDATLSPIQREVLGRREREKIVHGGSRLGKSVLGGCEGIIELMQPRTKLAVVAATYNHVSHEWQYIDRGMRQLFDGHPQAFQRIIFRHSMNYHDYEVTTIWNSRARGFSVDSDDGAALLGQEFTRVILGEGSHVSSDVHQHKIQRAIDGALMKRKDGSERDTGYISIFTTPTGHQGCSADEFDRIYRETKRQPELLHYGCAPFAETAWIREASVLENPVYDERVFESARRRLSTAAFEEQYLGKMVFRSGRVYTEFSEDHHIAPMPSVEWIRNARLSVGIDTGAYYAAVLVALGRDGVLRQLGEAYTQKVKIDESADETKLMVTDALAGPMGTDEWKLLKDRVEIWPIDPASQHKLEIMDLLDITVTTPSRGQGKFDLIPTIDKLRMMFATDKLYILDSAVWTLDQMRKYVWKTTKTTGSKDPVIREPRKDYDHVMDALRFAAVPLSEMGPLETPPPILTIKEAVEAQQRARFWGPLRGLMDRAERSGGIAS